MKKASWDVTTLHMCTKNHNHMMYASWDMEYDRHNFLSFWALFCPFTPLLTPKIKIWNILKKNWRYYPITHVYHKWRSYDVWFLRYKAQQFFVILGYFLPTNNWQPRKPKFWKNQKNAHRYYHFTHMYHKWKSYDVCFLRYGVQQAQFFLILDDFFPFYPPNNPENQNAEKMKKMPGNIIISHKCIINDKNMMYDPWEMKRNRQNLL